MNRKITNFLFILIMTGAFTFIAGLYMTNGERLQPNITINEIDVGKLTKQQAETKIKDIVESFIKDSYITVKADDRTWRLKYSDIKFNYNYNKAVEAAYSIGRKSNYFKNTLDALNARINGINFEMEFNYEANYINTLLSIIAKEVNEEAEDATIRLKSNGFVITDEKVGRELDQKKGYEMIKREIESQRISLIEIKMITTEPKIKRDDLAVIKDKLGEYSTRFNASDADRSYNITLATRSVTNVLVKPGETFSLNKIIGPRLEKFGYKIAKVIVNNELVPGIGGGVCQVSSTLYNAALLSNLKIVERRNHSLPSTYVAMGRDATISGDVIDLKILNNTNYPIYIYGEVRGSNVSFSIYGKNDYPARKVKIVTEVVNKKSPQMKIIEDPNLSIGTQIVEKKAQTGYTVKSYRIVYESGKEVLREPLYTDTYRVSNGVKRVGTKIIRQVDFGLEYEGYY